jgi:effector-binding domain-containing protein
MDAEPQISDRAALPYAGLPVTVTMASFAAAIDAGYPELFGWLAARNLTPAGPPLIRYLVVDMDAELEVELGVPVTEPVTGDDRIRPGELPAGPYVSLVHTGPYDELIAANAAVQAWAAEQGLTLESDATGQRFRGRAEHYLTDPSAEPDPSRWQTDVAYLIADDPAAGP